MATPTLEELVSANFPLVGNVLTFGYGSKVFRQAGNQARNEADLIDIIFVVDDPLTWHRQNLARNGHHYSSLRRLPNNAKWIAWLQESFGAKMYFNPYALVQNSIALKYGVIKTAHLVEDLSEWTCLYVAGRLQKPTHSIINNSDKNSLLKSALKFNRESALRAALLQLPESFAQSELHKTITSLSYRGDLRMLFGEDKNKVDNIVQAQSNELDAMYSPIIKNVPSFKNSILWSEAKKTYTQDLSPKVTFDHLRLLPRTARQQIYSTFNREVRSKEVDAVLAAVSRSINCDKVVARALSSIVRRSSLTQSLKGILTAGLIKSLKYSQRKLFKSLISRMPFA